MYLPAMVATSGLITLDKQKGRKKERTKTTLCSALLELTAKHPPLSYFISCSHSHSWTSLVWTTTGPLQSFPGSGILIFWSTTEIHPKEKMCLHCGPNEWLHYFSLLGQTTVALLWHSQPHFPVPPPPNSEFQSHQVSYCSGEILYASFLLQTLTNTASPSSK